MWQSRDEGTTWIKTQQLTANSIRNQSYARRPLEAHPDFYSLWADGNADKMSRSALYFCNKKGDKVWMLPYLMKKDFEQPTRVKGLPVSPGL
ncbi:MAG: hypothetical protein WKF89_13135 [Chitinophagaceae bacterium]